MVRSIELNWVCFVVKLVDVVAYISSPFQKTLGTIRYFFCIFFFYKKKSITGVWCLCLHAIVQLAKCGIAHEIILVFGLWKIRVILSWCFFF